MTVDTVHACQHLTQAWSHTTPTDMWNFWSIKVERWRSMRHDPTVLFFWQMKPKPLSVHAFCSSSLVKSIDQKMNLHLSIVACQLPLALQVPSQSNYASLALYVRSSPHTWNISFIDQKWTSKHGERGFQLDKCNTWNVPCFCI